MNEQGLQKGYAMCLGLLPPAPTLDLAQAGSSLVFFLEALAQ